MIPHTHVPCGDIKDTDLLLLKWGHIDLILDGFYPMPFCGLWLYYYYFEAGSHVAQFGLKLAF